MRPCTLVVVLAVLASSCAQVPPARPAFETWRTAHDTAVSAFEHHLAQAGLGGALPLDQLLRAASSWQTCQASPYAVPPAEQWPAVVSVLRLVGALRAAGVIGSIEVHSGYRDQALNACAGGAARSAHLRSFALDFTSIGPHDPTPGLCEFWRTEGRRWNMGLSRYPSGRVHVDTAGYRTWGADHTGATAVCGAPPPGRTAPPAPGRVD